MQRGRDPADAAAAALQQARETPPFRCEIVREHGARQRLRHENAVARDEPAGLGQGAMLRNEIRAWNAVAVEEHAIAATARRDRAIADLGEAKAIVLVAYMRQRCP